MITPLGCKSLFTGVATTTFNNDGKVIDHRAYSSNSEQILQCIGEYMATLVKKKEDEF